MKDDDLPELTDEMLVELRTSNQDLHLGPAKVKPLNKSWAEVHGPKPPGLAIRALDATVAVLGIGTLYLMLNVWIWIFTS
jgi:hypothetical protein